MLRTVKFLLTLVVLTPATARATEPYCQIRSEKNGSGCTIAFDKGVADVLTCAHVFPEKRPTVSVRFRQTDRWLDARLVAIDREKDVALVQVATPYGWNVRPAPLAEEAPDQGPVTISGYGNDAFQQHKTEIIGQYSKWRRVSGTGRFGDSGSPVLHRGKVVGVQHGMVRGARDAVFVPIEEVNEFLVERAGWER